MSEKQKICWSLAALLAIGCLALSGFYSSGKDHLAEQQLPVPPAPDYSDASQWYAIDRQGLADIFYVISTETGDHELSDGTLCHYADTRADSLRQPMLAEMKGVAELLAGTLNFYSPYYRQCSLQTFTSDSLIDARLPIAVNDVSRAFAHYLKHENQGRPFILAGFSQGAMIALQLLREMDDATYHKMVAAYLIGISIPQEVVDKDGGRRIRPARRADDTGVVISYNSARDSSCGIWSRSAFAINPANWRTDTEPASFSTEPSPLVALDRQIPEKLSVQLDTASNLLLVDGYTATDYMVPLIGREGSYHSREVWLYRDQLRRNIQTRFEAFTDAH